MSDKLIDLHMHTIYSDGRYTPTATVDYAHEKKLSAIAITDHDSFEGIPEASKRAAELGIELINGIELSCTHEESDIHMLAYFVDPTFHPLADKVKYYQEERLKRGMLIVQKLNEIGIDLRMDTVKAMAGTGVVGRVHVADALLKEEFVHTFDEAFNRYLGYHAPAYVPKTYFDPVEAVSLVHAAGGILVMAHPGTVRRDEAIPFLVEIGMDGIEVYHSKHTPAQVRHYKSIAEKHKLLMSGGSDWHGRNAPRADMGNQTVPYVILSRMKDYLASRKSS